MAKRQDRPDYVMLRKLFADLRAGMPKRCVILGSLELWEYQNTIRMTYEYTKNDTNGTINDILKYDKILWNYK